MEHEKWFDTKEKKNYDALKPWDPQSKLMWKIKMKLCVWKETKSFFFLLNLARFIFFCLNSHFKHQTFAPIWQILIKFSRLLIIEFERLGRQKMFMAEKSNNWKKIERKDSIDKYKKFRRGKMNENCENLINFPEKFNKLLIYLLELLHNNFPNPLS